MVFGLDSVFTIISCLLHMFRCQLYLHVSTIVHKVSLTYSNLVHFVGTLIGAFSYPECVIVSRYVTGVIPDNKV